MPGFRLSPNEPICGVKILKAIKHPHTIKQRNRRKIRTK
nr:MAG TPA: hypothetical protein [Bacteriophage sp.]